MNTLARLWRSIPSFKSPTAPPSVHHSRPRAIGSDRLAHDGPRGRRVSIGPFQLGHLRRQLVVRGNDPELLKQGEAVRNAPALDEATLGHAPDEKGAHAPVPI